MVITKGYNDDRSAKETFILLFALNSEVFLKENCDDK